MRNTTTMAQFFYRNIATDPLLVVILRTIHNNAIHTLKLRKNFGDLGWNCDAHVKSGDTGETKTENKKGGKGCEKGESGVVARPWNEMQSIN